MYDGCDGSGIVDASACVSSTFNCGENCVEGQSWERVSCYPASATKRDCSACSHLSLQGSIDAGTMYLQRPCSLFLDAIVKPCAYNPSSCAAGEEYWSNCTKRRDGMCIPCTNKICPLGQYVSQCYPDRDTECLFCNTRLQCTAPETYRSDCALSSNHACKACARCKLGETYESQPCTNVSNRECSPCTNLGACPDGYFKRSQCTLTQDTVCYPCSSKRPCPEGYYESAPCNATSDRVCSKCTAECPGGQYITGNCSAKADTQCTPCSSPSCEAGKYKTECRGRTDSTCANCSFPSGCPAGHFENQSCTPLTNRKCKKCFECSGNNYLVRQCSGTRDTECGYCLSWDLAIQNKWINESYVTEHTSTTGSISQYKTGALKVTDPSSASFCPAYPYSGTCRDNEFESSRCSAPPPLPNILAGNDRLPVFIEVGVFSYFSVTVDLDPKTQKNLELKCSDGMRWLYHPTMLHTCTSCALPCNPYRYLTR